MGIIKRVMRADFSSNNVGKYDFKNQIFRRKIDGKLERNYFALNGSTVDGYTKVDLSSRYYTVKTFFTYARHSGNHRIFSVADYASKRSFNVSHAKGTTSLTIQFWFCIGNNTYNYNINYPIDVTATIDIECEYTIDYSSAKIIKIEINGTRITIPAIATGVNTNAWISGQTRTICFGEIANYQTNAITSRAFPYFGQLIDSTNNVLLHFDLLGDNDAEILTDKAKLIQLQNIGVATIESSPIDI